MKLYIESNNIQVELIRFRKNIDFIQVYFFEPMMSTRLASLRLDCRYNITIVTTLSVTLSANKARTESISQMCMFDKRQFDYNRLLFIHSVSDCLEGENARQVPQHQKGR